MGSTDRPASTSPTTLSRSHGGLIFKELQENALSAESVIDFSVNSNPYGPCPDLVSVVRSTRFDTYPDTNAEELKVAVEGAYGISAERLVIGNGAADLLWTLATVIVSPGMSVMIVEPTFCEFRAACDQHGAKVHVNLPD